MSDQNRTRLFDRWAETYDDAVRSADEFPFGGYEQVLAETVRLATVAPRTSVLDLGTGTGNLTARFVALGCTVWGIDASAAMLAKARAKVPDAMFMEADVLGQWPSELPARFDRIVSAYVLHEFALDMKVGFLRRLAVDHLADDGRIVLADVAFATARARQLARAKWTDLWDEDEYYWAADEAIRACERVGLHATYTQVSSVGGVFVVEPSPL